MGKREFYINLCFAIFIFVLSFAWLKENVFTYSPLVAGGLSGISAAVVSFVFTWLLKNKNIYLKIGVLAIFVIAVAIFASNTKTEQKENIGVESIQGKWITQEEELTLKISIDDESMLMEFSPNNKQLLFDYLQKNRTVDFFNDQESENFQWEILKITTDSLVIMEKDQIIRFSKLK